MTIDHVARPAQLRSAELPAADRRCEGTAVLAADHLRRPLILRRPFKLDPAWRWFLLGFALIMVGFLVGPRIPDASQSENCVGNIYLPGPFGIHLNCDSPEFMALAQDPAKLLVEKNYRQSRPGLVLAAALLRAPLSFLAAPATPAAAIEQDPGRIIYAFTRYLPAYIA